MTKLTYQIYSHADTDGGIAAAIFSSFIQKEYGSSGWTTEVTPVNHAPQNEAWGQIDIQWPAAILDFTLHPLFLDSRYFNRSEALFRGKPKPKTTPPCYWIDHHPTGSSYPFIHAENLKDIMPNVQCLWDTDAISTPGLLRTHHETLGIPKKIIENYEELIDIAEIIDGALYASAESAHDFSSTSVKIQSLFSTSHPSIDKTSLYKRLCKFMVQFSDAGDLLDADPLFKGLIEYEQMCFNRQYKCYRQFTQQIDNVTLTSFFEGGYYEGFGRFIPYLLFPESKFAIHIMPKHKGTATITCGINPWNKPKHSSVNLGRYFADIFSGGGHAFVAGGKVKEESLNEVNKLIQHLNEATHHDHQ